MGLSLEDDPPSQVSWVRRVPHLGHDLRAWHASRHRIDHLVWELDHAGIFAKSANIAELCQHVAAWRQRPIDLISHPFPPTLAALVVARPQEDVIFFTDRVHPVLGQHAILHELAHLLLQHVQPDAPNLATDPRTDLARDTLTEQDLAHGHQRSLFQTRQEREAERMAYHLRTRWQEVRPQPVTSGQQDQDVWARWAGHFHPLDDHG